MGIYAPADLLGVPPKALPIFKSRPGAYVARLGEKRWTKYDNAR
jgi:hypothetical protein